MKGTTQSIALAAMRKHGITENELLVEMAALNICACHQREVLDRFLGGGPLAVGLAVALFGVIRRQNYMPKTIH